MNHFRKTRNSIKNAIDEDDMMSYDGSSGSYYDSNEDEDNEFVPAKRSRTITNVHQQQHPGQVVQRKPTRVPNLKIQNRNAVLARENRLRKKMLMEELEKSNEDLQAENRKLQKMMKFKDRKNEELMKEVRYLKSVIANRTGILSVLKSLPQAIAPKAKEVQQEKQVQQYAESCASSDTLSCDINDENGTKGFIDDPLFPTITDDLFLDIATEWDEILKNPFNSATTDFTDFPKLEISSPAASPSSSGVSSEHNYFYDEKILESIDNEEMIEEDSPGICVHINRGKVSLEFCAVCHNNSTSSWIN